MRFPALAAVLLVSGCLGLAPDDRDAGTEARCGLVERPPQALSPTLDPAFAGEAGAARVAAALALGIAARNGTSAWTLSDGRDLRQTARGTWVHTGEIPVDRREAVLARLAEGRPWSLRLDGSEIHLIPEGSDLGMRIGSISPRLQVAPATYNATFVDVQTLRGAAVAFQDCLASHEAPWAVGTPWVAAGDWDDPANATSETLAVSDPWLLGPRVTVYVKWPKQPEVCRVPWTTLHLDPFTADVVGAERPDTLASCAPGPGPRELCGLRERSSTVPVRHHPLLAGDPEAAVARVADALGERLHSQASTGSFWPTANGSLSVSEQDGRPRLRAELSWVEMEEMDGASVPTNATRLRIQAALDRLSPGQEGVLRVDPYGVILQRSPGSDADFSIGVVGHGLTGFQASPFAIDTAILGKAELEARAARFLECVLGSEAPWARDRLALPDGFEAASRGDAQGGHLHYEVLWFWRDGAPAGCRAQGIGVRMDPSDGSPLGMTAIADDFRACQP